MVMESQSGNAVSSIIVSASDREKYGHSSDDAIKYQDVINYLRCTKSGRICVMCGRNGDKECVIPAQNKDVCKTCDKACWLCSHLNVVVKFCKGCKNFTALKEFQDKPDASKCGSCRNRGRQNYFARKKVDGDNKTSSCPKNDVTYGSTGGNGTSDGRSSNGTTMDIRFASGPPFVLPWTSSPEFLYERITVVESRPGVLLHGMCSLCQWWCLSLPLVVMMSLSYTASISAGLAFINSLPVFWLDGDDALGAWLQLLMPKAKKKKVMLSCIICIPTFILYS